MELTQAALRLPEAVTGVEGAGGPGEGCFLWFAHLNPRTLSMTSWFPVDKKLRFSKLKKKKNHHEIESVHLLLCVRKRELN